MVIKQVFLFGVSLSRTEYSQNHDAGRDTVPEYQKWPGNFPPALGRKRTGLRRSMVTYKYKIHQAIKEVTSLAKSWTNY